MSEQNLFSKYLGKLEVDVDGETLELDVRLKDKQKIMSLMSAFGEEVTEEKLDGLSVVFKDVLERSYPNVDKDQFDAFLLYKFESFMTGLAVAFGWTTKKELDEKVEEQAKKKLEPQSA